MDDLVLRRNVANLLRIHMASNRMDFKIYSKKANLHYKTLENLSKEKGNPTLKTFVKIAKCMDINLKDLLFNEDIKINQLKKI